MAHYAFLDENNIVVSVIAGKDEGLMDWEQFYSMQMGMACKRTSYNTRAGIYYEPHTTTPAADQSKAFRKNYAGIGFTYDPQRGAFIPPKPHPSWTLDEFECIWKPPVPYPTDEYAYFWDEEKQLWVRVE